MVGDIFHLTTLRKQLILAALGIPTQQDLVDVDVDLDLNIYELLWSDVKIQRESGGGGIRVLNLAGDEFRDIWCDRIVPISLTLPVVAPGIPVGGSIYYDIATDVIKVYGGFPPAWHDH